MSEPKESWKTVRTTNRWANLLARHAPTLHKEWIGMFVASTKRGKLPEKMKHLVWVAVDTVVTHLYSSGAILHSQEAMAHGATVAEVMDTLRLACIPATRGLRHGYPLLAEALAKRQAKSTSKADVAPSIGQDFMKSYQAFIDGQLPGGLDARHRSLIKLAVVCNPATAYPEETRAAIEEALDLGADAGEILEVMELATLITAHAFSISLDGLAETLTQRSTG